jgi:uncharacterized protein (TIGR00369 family)
VITDEPVRGRFAYLEHPWLLSLSGLEQMRRFQRKEIPYGPLFYLCGGDLMEAGPGTATFAMPAGPWLQSSAGVMTGGVQALIADASLGGALLTTFEPRTALATSELSMNFLRPATTDSGSLIARAKLIQAGRSQGLTEASLEDGRGHLLAHATSRCVIMRLPEAPDPPDDPFPIEWPRYEGPDPYKRPVEGEVLSQDVWDRMSGLEMVDAWVRQELPCAPVDHLMGLRSEGAAEGEYTCSMPASQWFCTSSGTFYGGAVALLADYAMNGAVHTVVGPATSWGTLDLKVNFLRPVIPDGRPVTARASIAHRGRTVAVAAAELTGADGKTVALANSSAMLMPGRPWKVAAPAAPIDEAPVEEDPANRAAVDTQPA